MRVEGISWRPTNKEQVDYMVAYINQCHLAGKFPTFKEVADSRTAAQNDLFGAWYGELSEQTGNTPEYCHAYSKLKVGIPIIEISTAEKSRVSREVWQAVGPALDHKQKMHLMRELDVTSVMTVKEASRYLEAMQEFWLAEANITLVVRASHSYSQYLKAAA